MGIWSWLRGDSFLPEIGEQFSEPTYNTTDPEILQAFFPGLYDPNNFTLPVSRAEAMRVPAVKDARDLICNTLGRLPMGMYDTERVARTSNLLTQPEANIPRSVTMTRTYEDLLLDGVAWWKVVKRDWQGYPDKIERCLSGTVSQDADGVIWHDGKRVNPADMIQFLSPTDPLLVAGARAIRTLMQLDRTAAMYAENPQPLELFTPAEGADPADDDDIVDMLTAYKAVRQNSSVGYIPAALKHNTIPLMSAREMQLADARNHAVLEIARLVSLDPYYLGLPVASRPYVNAETSRQDLIDFTFGGYMQAFEDRLSMGDVTKRGYYVKTNLDAFLRSDTKTRMETYEIGRRIGAYTHEEIRSLEDRPSAPEPAPTVTAEVIPQRKEIMP